MAHLIERQAHQMRANWSGADLKKVPSLAVEKSHWCQY